MNLLLCDLQNIFSKEPISQTTMADDVDFLANLVKNPERVYRQKEEITINIIFTLCLQSLVIRYSCCIFVFQNHEYLSQF